MFMKPIRQKATKVFRTKVLAGAGGLFAAAVSVAYSLYQSREAENIPQLAVGIPIDAGRWEVLVSSSAVGGTMPNGARVQPGQQVIVIDMTLENISAESSNLYRDLIKLENIADPPMPQFYLVRDNDILWDLQPMMPEAVKAVWQVPADMDLPKILKIQIEGSQFKPRDNLYAAPGWFSSGAIAQVALPLTTASPSASPEVTR